MDIFDAFEESDPFRLYEHAHASGREEMPTAGHHRLEVRNFQNDMDSVMPLYVEGDLFWKHSLLDKVKSQLARDYLVDVIVAPRGRALLTEAEWTEFAALTGVSIQQVSQEDFDRLKAEPNATAIHRWCCSRVG